MANEKSDSLSQDHELQLAELRREYLSRKFEEASDKGKNHRVREIRRSIARLLTQSSNSER
jgi:ribosomal protein L29